MKDRDLILNTDVADTIQGHVGPSTKQVFQTLTAVPFSLPRLKLAGYEFVMRDQFGNYYHKMRAVLFDGELYDVDQFIKPSMMMKWGGGYADLADKVGKGKLKITEHLLQALRDNGAVTFARTNLDLLKARSLSTAPVAIETQDITHQANRLEDALRAAKLERGERVLDEPTAPDGFQGVAAQRAAESKIPQLPLPMPDPPAPAEVIAFPSVVGMKPKSAAEKPAGPKVVDALRLLEHKRVP